MVTIEISLLLWYARFVDYFFAVMFFFVPSWLRIFSASMLVLTIGKMLDVFESRFPKILKWLIYILFMIYSAYTLLILTNVKEMSLLDVNTIIFGILAPISMMILGRYIMQIKVKNRQIFTYYTLWLMYIIIALIWKIIFPEQVLFSLVLMYALISMFTVWLFTKLHKEMSK